VTADTGVRTKAKPIVYLLRFSTTLGLPWPPARLAVELNQHVFDTLYHAVALESAGCTLITGDLRYLRKASPYGRIAALEQGRDATSS